MEEGSNGSDSWTSALTALANSKRTSSPPQLIVDERPATQVTATSPTSRARMNRSGAVSNRTLWQPFDCGYERCEAAAVKHEQKPSRPPIKVLARPSQSDTKKGQLPAGGEQSAATTSQQQAESLIEKQREYEKIRREIFGL
ncbi:hypothetical protein GGF37_000151 [Kickxella alabastrina]|nr:hypothetical protein GGF37_000151 [Kickxella alabastrina]